MLTAPLSVDNIFMNDRECQIFDRASAKSFTALPLSSQTPYRMRKYSEVPFMSLIAVAWVGWTSHLGGHISHPESRADFEIEAESEGG
jgi:hypothetical protein